MIPIIPTTPNAAPVTPDGVAPPAVEVELPKTLPAWPTTLDACPATPVMPVDACDATLAPPLEIVPATPVIPVDA